MSAQASRPRAASCGGKRGSPGWLSGWLGPAFGVAVTPGSVCRVQYRKQGRPNSVEPAMCRSPAHWVQELGLASGTGSSDISVAAPGEAQQGPRCVNSSRPWLM